MENIKWLDKWYSKHVIDNFKELVSIEISTKKDLGWKLSIDFRTTNYRHLKLMEESKRVSDFNYFSIVAKDKKFVGEGDFTKLDFLIGKFRAFVGETDIHAIEHDLFLNPDIQDFIFEKEKNSLIFLHYTADQGVAENIIRTGFEFSVAFDKTTTTVFNDPIDINYNHLVRKPFGKYIVVICISKKIYDKYSKLISKAGNKYLKVEEVLRENLIKKNDSDEDLFTLHKNFIKGFFNYSTGEIRTNKTFDSSYDSDQFKKNIS